MLFQGAEYSEEAAEKLNEALGWLDFMLEGRVFVAGDNLTIADISIIVVFSNLEVNLTLYPLRRIWKLKLETNSLDNSKLLVLAHIQK